MIEIIKKEPVSFGLRLKQLKEEKQVSNGTIANYVGVSKNTVSNWITGRHPLVRFEGEMLKKLSNEFDVDIEYLKCNQIEKKLPTTDRKQKRRKRRKRQCALHIELKRFERIINVLNMYDIEVFPAGPYYEQEFIYQIISNGFIYTIKDIQYVSGGRDYDVIFPDGFIQTKTPEQLIELSDRIKNICYERINPI